MKKKLIFAFYVLFFLSCDTVHLTNSNYLITGVQAPFIIDKYFRSITYATIDKDQINQKVTIQYQHEMKRLYDTDNTTAKFSFRHNSTGGGGVFWNADQNPEGVLVNNVRVIHFYAAGSTGNELIQFIIGGFSNDNFKDKFKIQSRPVRLTKEWKHYSIETGTLLLSETIIQPFGWWAGAKGNPEGIVFYLDNLCADTSEGNAIPIPSPLPGDTINAPFLINDYFGATGFSANSNSSADYVLSNQPRPGDDDSICQKVNYVPGEKGYDFLFWLNNDNWGKFPGKHIRNAKTVTFWVRGDSEGSIVKFGVGSVKDTNLQYQDFLDIESSVKLSKEWTKYTIQLPDKNQFDLLGAFSCKFESASKITFYLDDIKYE